MAREFLRDSLETIGRRIPQDLQPAKLHPAARALFDQQTQEVLEEMREHLDVVLDGQL